MSEEQAQRNPEVDPIICDPIQYQIEQGEISRPKAVILLSGGLDSATALAIALDRGYDCYPLSFNYGQQHDIEVQSAIRISRYYGLAEKHKLIKLQGHEFKGSSLTDDSISTPKDRKEEDMAKDIPVTYVPARNTIFLAYALSLSEQLDALSIVCGVNALDYSGYPDCRPEYIFAFQDMIDVATKKTVEGGRIALVTPLIMKKKVDIIRWGLELGVPYHLTSSCYEPTIAYIKGVIYPAACGKCDSCILRRAAFRDLNEKDPTFYRPTEIPTELARDY